jgi:Ca2+-binding RTX toxin-like protein
MRTSSRLLAVPLVAAVVAVLALTPTASGSHPAKARPIAAHRCHGHKPTISKGAGNNTIVGTRHRDIIWAGAGRDRVLGRGGNDLICGGPGLDVLDGNQGSDTIYGGAGKDWCVAWHPREHRLHHACEVHVGLHGRHHMRGSRTAKLATTTTQPAIDARSARRALITDCGVTGYCYAGVAHCADGSYDWLLGGPDVRSPAVYSPDGGYVAIVTLLSVLTADGQLTPWHWTNVKVYRVQPGTSNLLPDPARNYPAGVHTPAAGTLTAYFAYSRDGQAWSAWQGTVATRYIAGGLGSGTGDIGIITGECDL